jgi:diguanylate cyclase (GGDEF)-like protein/PAS domain S-box-containing protein
MSSLPLNPALRISIALVAIMLGMLVGLDLVLGIMPSPAQTAQKVQREVSGALAVQIAALIAENEVHLLERTLADVVQRNPQIGSIGVRRRDGQLLAQTSEHARLWKPQSDTQSTLNYARVPLMASDGLWGEVEIAFSRWDQLGPVSWRDHPLLITIALVGVAGLLFCYSFVRRTLQELDPSGAVPEHVQEAFDTLPDGVVVLNQHGRVVMANKAFRRLHPMANRAMVGEKLSDEQWLLPALLLDSATHPWSKCLAGEALAGDQLIQIPQPSGQPVQALVNCTPVRDGESQVRGCLVIFDEVSHLQQTNDRLKKALMQLEVSRKHVERRNKQLQALATRDPLTDCLNRRALFERAAPIFARAAGEHIPLSCIMGDIDRFKSLNDTFGHALGDQVIKNVAAILRAGLRDDDLLGRYGGEEFCIILPEAGRDHTLKIAERLREQIEELGNSGLQPTDVPKVTCSFGVAVLAPGDADLSGLIARADQALYAAKHAGRNRVICSDSQPAGAAT